MASRRPTAGRPRRSPPRTRRRGLRNLVELQLNWEPSRVRDAVDGVQPLRRVPHPGRPSLRMCPIFRFLPGEEASPRAKANLIRGVLTGALDLQAVDQRRVQGGGRPLRPLPLLPAGMSGGRGHSPA